MSAAHEQGAPTVVTCLPLTEEEAFVTEAARHGATVLLRTRSADELAAAIPVVRPSRAAVLARPHYLTAELVATCDQWGVRILVGATSREELRYARQFGLTAVTTPLPWEPAAVAPPAADGAGATPAAPSAPAPGRVVAVWGTAGAPGRTTLAIAVAAEFARASGRVLLADADTRAASVALALGLLDEAPGFAAACRLAGVDSLTDEELERLAEPVPLESVAGSLRVLSGLSGPTRWAELTSARMTTVIDACRRWAAHTVIDVAADAEASEAGYGGRRAPGRDDATRAAIEHADDVILLGSADAIGVSRLVRAHGFLRELAPDARVVVVVNKLRGSALGASAQRQVRHALSRFAGIDELSVIPWDPAACDRALLTATPVTHAAPRSPVALAIRDLAATQLGAGIPERKNGFGRRTLRLA